MERIDFTTIWGKLILVILAMLAEIFVDNLREEAKKGKKGRVLIKKLHNGPIPWGYCAGKCFTCKDLNGPGYCHRVGLPNLSQDGRMVPHPIDSQGFKYATSLYLLGTYTHKKVADALNEFKVETPDGRLVQIRSRGKLGKEKPCPFTKDMVREMLKNPIYTGVIPYYSSHYDGKRVIKYLEPQDIFPGVHLALITKSQFKQMQEIRDLKSKAPQGGGKIRRPARVYLLQGLLDCHRCGAPMHCQAGSKNNRRHHCRTHLQRTGGCDQPSVMADRLEADLINQLAQVKLPVSWQEEIIGYLIDEEGLAMILAQRQALKEHIEMIRDMHHQKQISRQVYLQEWQEFERSMARLSLEKSTTIDLNDARLLLADFPLLWSKLTALEQKHVTQIFLNRATVEDGRIIAWDWNTPFADLINVLQ